MDDFNGPTLRERLVGETMCSPIRRVIRMDGGQSSVERDDRTPVGFELAVFSALEASPVDPVVSLRVRDTALKGDVVALLEMMLSRVREADWRLLTAPTPGHEDIPGEPRVRERAAPPLRVAIHD